MRSYFLTGCTGFIGTALVRELCKRKDTAEIVLLTRNPQARYQFYAFDKRVKLYEGDVRTCRLPDAEFTDIIHGSNESQGSEPHTNYYTMVEGTHRMLSWAFGRAGLRPNVLLLSSGAAKTAETPYGQGKRLCELLAGSMANSCKIARIYTLVGEQNPVEYAIGAFIRQAIDYRKVSVINGGKVQRSYLHTADCARWLLTILEDGAWGLPVDVGGSKTMTIKEVAALVAEVFGVKCESWMTLPEKESVYLPDLRHAKSLGLKETISLKKALERIRDDHRLHHPDVEAAKAA